MKQKLLYFVLGFFILLLSFPLFNSSTAYAGIQDCGNAVGKNVNFEFSPFPATTADNSIRLKLSGLAKGKYQLWKEVGGNEKWSFETSSGTYQIPNPIFQRENNFYEDDTVKVVLYQVLNGGGLVPRCEDFLKVTASSTPPDTPNNCSILMGLKVHKDKDVVGNPKGLKPTVPIYFHVEGDIGDDENARRGVVFKDETSGSDNPSTCKTNKELTEGFKLTNSYSGELFGSGKYTLKVLRGCTIFDTPEPQSGNLCPPHAVTIDANGGGEGERKVEGSACTRDNPETEVVNEDDCLPVDLYCIKDLAHPGHNVCSKIEPIQEKCNSGECETALGNIPYDPVEFVRRILALVLSLAGGIFLLFTIISGYRLMVSQGDPEKVKEARESLVSALAGLLFIIFSLVILQFIVRDVLNLPGF